MSSKGMGGGGGLRWGLAHLWQRYHGNRERATLQLSQYFLKVFHFRFSTVIVYRKKLDHHCSVQLENLVVHWLHSHLDCVCVCGGGGGGVHVCLCYCSRHMYIDSHSWIRYLGFCFLITRQVMQPRHFHVRWIVNLAASFSLLLLGSY